MTTGDNKHPHSETPTSRNSSREKNKKTRLFPQLNVNVPIPQELAMILPSLALSSEDQTNVLNDDNRTSGSPDQPSPAEISSAVVASNETSDSLVKQTPEPMGDTVVETDITDNAHVTVSLNSSHHLSTKLHPMVHRVIGHTSSTAIPNMPVIQQPAPHTNPQPTTQTPVTYIDETIKGKYGSLHVTTDGHYTFTLNPTAPAYVLLHKNEPGTDTFTLHLSKGAQILVQIPVQGHQDAPKISGVLQGSVTEDHNVDSNGLISTAGKIDVVDPDHDQSAVQPETIIGKYGTLSIDSQGHWQYLVQNSQANIQALTSQTSLHESFVIHTKDGTPQVVNMSIGGTDDNASITGGLGSVTEDKQTSITGQLSIVDPDANQDHFIATQQTGLFGHLELTSDGSWHYILDNNKPEIQHLNQTEHRQEVFTVRSADGTTHSITIDVEGNNDAPSLQAQSHSVDEDGAQLSGQMVGKDIDNNAVLTYSIANPIDGLTLSSDGSYRFDPTNSAYQHLVQGQTQTLTIPVTVTDEHGASTTQNLEIAITGTNDGAQITGTDTGDVYESTYADRSPDYQRGNISHLWNDSIHTSGKLTIIDQDSGEAHFDNNAPHYQYFGQYGRLILQQDGNWSYYADVGNSPVGRKIDALGNGEQLTDTITIRSADGTTHDIVITIHGDNDSPYVSGQVQLNSGKEDLQQTITQAELLSHSLDVDTNDAGKLSIANLRVDHGTILDNQDGTYTFTPDKDYNGPVHFLYDVKDAHGGTTPTGASLTLTPTPDNAHISYAISDQDQAGVTEDRSYIDTHDNLHFDGKLNIVDPDKGEAQFDINLGSQTYQGIGYDTKLGGHVLLQQDGNYTYTIKDHQPLIQTLSQGETITDECTIKSQDGTIFTIQVTIHGSNDAPTLSAQHHTVTEDGAVLSGQMIANDIDHNAKLTYSIAQRVDGLTLNADGSYAFDPGHPSYQHLQVGQVQTLTIPVTVTDERHASATENLTITITGTNDAPIVTPLTDSVKEDSDSHHQLDLLQGATDQEGDALSIGQIQCNYQGHNGALPPGVGFAKDGHTLLVDATSSTFQHLAAGEKETIIFHYQVTDSHGAATAQTATITVIGTDDKAQVVSSNIDLTEGEALKTYQRISDYSGHLALQDPDSHNKAQFVFDIIQGSQNVGVLTIWPDGDYRYYVDPARNHHAHYAVNELKTGESLTEHFQVKTSDGQTKDITVTIHGEDNQAYLEVVDPNLLPVNPNLYEDRTSFSDPTKLYAGGLIRVHDPDHDDAQAIAHSETTAHGGHFWVSRSGSWSYTIDNNSSEVQNLGSGESFTESFTITSKDGSASQVVTVTIHGSNDNPLVTSQVQLATGTEDSPLTLTQAELLAHSHDIDNNDVGRLTVDNLQADHGTVRDNHDGTYTFTPDKDYNGNVQFTYDVKDAHGGVTHTGATTTLTAKNDVASFSGADTGSVTEDVHVQGNTPRTIFTTGVLNISDPDTAQDHFHATHSAHAIHDPYGGSLSIGKAGDWTYSVPNANVQHLSEGESQQVQYEVQGAGGDKHVITVTIHGSNDAPTITSQTTVHTIDEDSGHSISDSVLISDVDHNDHLSVSIDAQHQPKYGHVIYDDQTRTWNYQLNDGNPDVNALNDGDTITDKFTINVADGHGGTASKEVQIVINGHTDTQPVPTLVAPAHITGGPGNQDLHTSVGQPPQHHSGNGWGILTGGGHVVTSLQGQFGTLHVDPQTGHLDYDYSSSSGVIKTHGGGSYGSGTDETDSFVLTLDGSQNSQVAVHLHLHSQSVHGSSGHHIDMTTLTGIDVSPLAPPPPPPPVFGQSDEEIDQPLSVDMAFTYDDASHSDHGAAAYLSALGLQVTTESTDTSPQPVLPDDIDIVLAQDQNLDHSLDTHNSDVDLAQAGEHGVEHDDGKHKDLISPDEHHDHADPSNFIDPY
jgi:VCBS repeat-containing protein